MGVAQERVELGLLGRSPLWPELMGLPIERRFAVQLHQAQLADQLRTFALPLTLTPFASARPCSARCTFCSETLQHRDAQRLSASLRPGAHYGAQLRAVLKDLRTVPLGFSLSGLEQTDDPDFFATVLDAVKAHRESGAPIEESVLYSNGAGLTQATHGARLLPRLREITRIELSRHASTQPRNDAIMRFRPGVEVARREVFERVAQDAAQHTHVRLVCVVQRGGVWDLDTLRAYLDWARAIGVRDVVFRELSRLGDLYRPNRTLRLIEDGRVAIESLIAPALGWDALRLERVTAGYYWWNLRARWDDVEVTFETSDYVEMKRRHQSGVIYKLVFHADGTLGADWDPDREVLHRY